MGGSGQGSNPEQLFSAGYAGCFLGALQLCAKKAGKDASGATVEVLTGIGPADSAEGFALNIELKISGFNDEAVVNAAHQVRVEVLCCRCIAYKRLANDVAVAMPLFACSRAWR